MLAKRTLARSSLLATVAVAALAQPAVADRWVATNGQDNLNCFEGSPCETIQHAVGLADPGETIHIGSGTFEEAVLAEKRVNFSGVGDAGLTRTVILAPDTQKDPGLELTDGGEVRNVQVFGSIHDLGRPAVVLSAPDPQEREVYAVENVSLHAGEYASSGVVTNALNVQGNLEIEANDLLLKTRTDAAGNELLYASGPLTGTFDDVTFEPSRRAGLARFGDRADVTLSDARVENGVGEKGIHVNTGAQVELHRVHVASTGQPFRVEAGLADAPTRVDLYDTLVEAIGGGPFNGSYTALEARSGPGSVELGVYRSTLVALGGDQTSALDVAANAPASRTQVDLRGSAVMVGGGGLAGRVDIDARESNGGETVVTAYRSAYATVLTSPGVEVTPAGTNGGIGQASFVDWPARDYRPSGRMREAGDPEGLASDARDVFGDPRLVDADGMCGAQPDIGAIESQFASAPGECPVPPEPGPDPQQPGGGGGQPGGNGQPGGGDQPGGGTGDQPGPGTQPTGPTDQQRPTEQQPPRDTLAPRLTGLALPKRLTIKRRGSTSLSVKVTLSEAARVTAHVERRVGKRWVRVTKPVTKQHAAGKRTVKLALGRKAKLRSGKHRVVITAIDAAGNRAAQRTGGFSLR